MASGDLPIDWDPTPTDFSLTDLHSLAANNLWLSNAITADPSDQYVMISAELHCNAGVVENEQINFYLIRGDGAASSAIRTGGVTNIQQEISVANTISDVKDAAGGVLSAVRIDRADQDIEHIFIFENPGPDWQLAIELVTSAGALDATGNMVRYRLGRHQEQA